MTKLIKAQDVFGFWSLRAFGDGNFAASSGSDGKVRIWDLAAGVVSSGWTPGRSGTHIDITEDGRLCVNQQGIYVEVRELKSGNRLATLGDHSARVTALKIARRAPCIASGCADGTIHLWNLESHCCSAVLGRHEGEIYSLALTPDGHRVVSASDDKSVRVWDVATTECTLILKGHTGPVNGVAVSADGRWALSGSADKTVRAWDLEKEACVHVLKGHSERPTQLAITLDGQRGISGGQDGEVRIWNLLSGKCEHILRTGSWVGAIDLALSGTQLLIGANGAVWVWKVPPPKQDPADSPPAHSGWPQGRRFGVENGKIRLLFLSAAPTDKSRIRCDVECREIKEKLRLSNCRQRFSLETEFAVRPEDLSQALLDTKPHILHFSGHGNSRGELLLEDVNGQALPLEGLSDLLARFADDICCVVLNSCFSERQGRLINQHIRYVIGVNQELLDDSAIAFSVGFYQALGAGRSIEEAFELGKIQVMLWQGKSAYGLPILLKQQRWQGGRKG